MSARDDILYKLRETLGRADLPFPPTDAPPLTAETRMTVTSAEGDLPALAARFGAELTTLHGSSEVVHSPAEARMALMARLQEWWTRDEAAVKGARLITGQERQVLSWAPDALPVAGVAEALADVGFQVVAPAALFDEANRAAVRHIRYGVTGVEAAFASTGSMLLVSGPLSSRAASLLPLRHIALIPFSRLYPTIEAWLARQRQGDLVGLMRRAAHLTLITGPSKSGDIEMNLTLGVHGPRYVHAILFDDRNT